MLAGDALYADGFAMMSECGRQSKALEKSHFVLAGLDIKKSLGSDDLISSDRLGEWFHGGLGGERVGVHLPLLLIIKHS